MEGRVTVPSTEHSGRYHKGVVRRLGFVRMVNKSFRPFTNMEDVHVCAVNSGTIVNLHRTFSIMQIQGYSKSQPLTLWTSSRALALLYPPFLAACSPIPGGCSGLEEVGSPMVRDGPY